jgi:hypothetical protein
MMCVRPDFTSLGVVAQINQLVQELEYTLFVF